MHIAGKLSILYGSNGKVTLFQLLNETPTTSSVPNVRCIISSCSTVNLPLHHDKKPKLFTSLNRFTALSTENDFNDDVFSMSYDNRPSGAIHSTDH
jgi:hypothetical protein